MEKNIEITETGLRCDNCDWKDKTIPYEKYVAYINSPCLECGENILTEEDYQLSVNIHTAMDFINSLSKEELIELYGNDINNIKNNPLFANVEGVENLTDNSIINATISMHKKIEITNIKIDNEDNKG